MKQNCWEYKKCQRGPGGEKVKESGMCAAAAQTRLDGVHGGKNGGRACWILCFDHQQESFHSTFAQCARCDFYRNVKNEEGADFVRAPELLKRIKSKD